MLKKAATLVLAVILILLLTAAITVVNLSTQTYGAISAAQEPHGLTNANAALQSQAVSSGTAYYITSSNINLPAALVNGIKIGTVLRWHIALTKTGAGTGTFQVLLYMGTNGSTADTVLITQTIGTQTAVVDTMVLDVQIAFTAVGAGTGSFFWSMTPLHQAATATGFGVSVTTGTFNGTISGLTTTTASLKFGLGFIATTGTPTITVPLVQAQAFNLD